MRPSLRIKLLAIAALAAGTLGILAAFQAWSSKAVARELTRIEEEYVPLLEYGPELERRFEQLRRAYQDAVATYDPNELAKATALVQRIEAELDAAEPSLGAEPTGKIRTSLRTYAATATDVAQRLIRGETGEPIVESIRSMQAEQHALDRRIKHATRFELPQLEAAFDAARSVQRTVSRTHVGFAIAASIVILLLAIGVILQIVRSVRDLSAGLSQIGRGEFDVKLDDSAHDELGDIAREANRMAASLHEINQRVEAKQRELEQSNHELESFSYSVSHDLRAPLRAVDGFSQVLLTRYADQLDEQARHYLDRIRKGAQRMSHLIDDLLKLSRIGRAPLRRETVDVSGLAERVGLELRRAEPEREVELRVEPGLRAEADEGLLAIVFENLLGNAWKFTSKRARAEISVGGELREGVRAFVVRDDGAGFDPTYASRLFAPFQRLHAQQEFEGTGIGLATVRRIVTRHGGRIWVEAAVDRGASFYFTLGDKK